MNMPLQNLFLQKMSNYLYILIFYSRKCQQRAIKFVVLNMERQINLISHQNHKNLVITKNKIIFNLKLLQEIKELYNLIIIMMKLN